MSLRTARGCSSIPASVVSTCVVFGRAWLAGFDRSVRPLGREAGDACPQPTWVWVSAQTQRWTELEGPTQMTTRGGPGSPAWRAEFASWSATRFTAGNLRMVRKQWRMLAGLFVVGATVGVALAGAGATAIGRRSR